MTPPDSDEAGLVSRAQQGDREAFAELVSRHAGPVLNTTLRMVGRRTDAEDLAQETFIAAFRALPNFRAEARFSTWLYRIAMNKSLDWLRRTVVREEASSHDEETGSAEAMAIERKTPEDALIEKQRVLGVDRALRALSPIYREAFVLRHLEGLSYEEMSEALGVDGGTLRMRVYKARTQLERELAPLFDRKGPESCR